jgi:hypothetical protein
MANPGSAPRRFGGLTIEEIPQRGKTLTMSGEEYVMYSTFAIESCWSKKNKSADAARLSRQLGWIGDNTEQQAQLDKKLANKLNYLVSEKKLGIKYDKQSGFPQWPDIRAIWKPDASKDAKTLEDEFVRAVKEAYKNGAPWLDPKHLVESDLEQTRRAEEPTVAEGPDQDEQDEDGKIDHFSF